MRDQFELDLEDPELLSEVQLLVALMEKANEHSGPLTAQEIDATLGLEPPAQSAA